MLMNSMKEKDTTMGESVRFDKDKCSALSAQCLQLRAHVLYRPRRAEIKDKGEPAS